MKVTIILGRGIEGCGVTKFAVEQVKWFKNNGHETHVFAVNDKKWTRTDSHDTAEFAQLKIAKPDQADLIINQANQSDVVIINSLPSVKHPEKCLEQFTRIIDSIKVPMINVQHDHSIQSIRRNACQEQVVKKSIINFSHSSTSDFAKYVTEITAGFEDLFTDASSTAAKTVINFQPGIDFDSIQRKYWKLIEEQDPLSNKWIGRNASWKGCKQMFDFHDQFLKPNGFLTTMEGIERSQGYLGFRELANYHELMGKDINTYDLSKGYGDEVYVFGSYNNAEMLERMSKTAFGYQLSLLKDRFIERSIEYTHCELPCVGVIPVYRKAYGDACTHRLTGDPLTQSKNSGTVWLDENNMAPAFELISKLSKDKTMRDEHRHMAFQFYRDHQDASFTFKEMFDHIEKALAK